MNSKSARLAFAVLGIVAASAVAIAPLTVGAQTAPRQLPANPAPNARPPAPAPRPDQQFDRGNTRDPRGFDRRGNRLERRLDFLRTELRITAAQQRLWDDFATVVRAEAEQAPGPDVDRRDDRGRDFDRRDDVRGRNDAGRFTPPSVVERLERRQQNLAQRAASTDHVLTALRPLYAAFSEDQRRAADELMFRPDQGRFGRNRFTMGERFNRPFDRPFGPFNRPYDYR